MNEKKEQNNLRDCLCALSLKLRGNFRVELTTISLKSNCSFIKLLIEIYVCKLVLLSYTLKLFTSEIAIHLIQNTISDLRSRKPFRDTVDGDRDLESEEVDDSCCAITSM